MHGLGAADMKAGLAVMIELARWVAAEQPALAVDLAFLFFPREELPAVESALPAFLETGHVDEAELVVVLEPTRTRSRPAASVAISATLVFEGRSGHFGAAWLADNAIDRAVRGLSPLVELAAARRRALGPRLPRGPVGDAAPRGDRGNVCPPAPRRRSATATRTRPHARGGRRRAAAARRRAGPARRLANSPAARVVVDTPLARKLREAGDFAVEPKQAWTPVWPSSPHGLDAVNLGPGDPRYAHTADEQVDAASLERTFRALQRFALGSV